MRGGEALRFDVTHYEADAIAHNNLEQNRSHERLLCWTGKNQ